MYIGYQHDRNQLNFSSINDVRDVEPLSESDLINFIKKTPGILVAYIVKKGNQLFMLIFSKESLVAVLIFITPLFTNVDLDVYRPSSDVYSYCISKSSNLTLRTNLNSFKSSSPSLDSILTIHGGDDDDLNQKEIEKLLKSIVAKSPESSVKETSLNKFLKKTLKLIEKVISNQKVWRILSELEKPLDPRLSLSGPCEVRSTDLLGPLDNRPKTQSKGSFIFAEALPNTQVGARKIMIESAMKKSPLIMAQTSASDSFSDGLTPSGLSINHQKLPENIRKIEEKTQHRRVEPLQSSKILDESFKYSEKQLEKKGLSHLSADFGVSIEGKTNKQISVEYHHCIEEFLQQTGVIRRNGTLNKQELSINFGDPISRMIVVFENNPLYKDKYFISGYKINQEAFDNFEKTGNIGLSQTEREQKFYKYKATKTQQKSKKIQYKPNEKNADSFWSTLPADAKLSTFQLKEAKMFKKALSKNPNFLLNDKAKDLIKKADKYYQHKREYLKKKTNLFDDEL